MDPSYLYPTYVKKIEFIYQINNNDKAKRSFCRFYLRGLCILSRTQCQFSHGVDDLIYMPWHEGYVVEYDYLQYIDFTQKKAIKGPRIYLNLYEFQRDKKYTFEDLNDNRQYRLYIRKQLHQSLFEYFMYLLYKTYPGMVFTEYFLIREYTRVGFNKLMTRIKFSHLTEYLCEQPTSKYYKDTSTKNTALRRRASKEDINKHYLKIFEDVKGNELEEAQVKKLMFQTARYDMSIPPLNIILKYLRLSFPEYIRKLVGQEEPMKLYPTPEILCAAACEYLYNTLKSKLVEWKDIYQHLSKQFNINNGNTINQIKPMLVTEGYLLLFFPMLQLFVPSQSSFKLTSALPCECEYQTMYPWYYFMSEAMSWDDYLPKYYSFDITDMPSLLRFAPHLLNSKVLGVDLYGRLRRDGYIYMIQLNNTHNTFLIDIYQMDLNGDIYTFTLVKKILRNVMADDNILKVFHDCRHDSLALHEFMCTCVKNVFDTSAVETYLGQLYMYRKAKHDIQLAKEALSTCVAVRTPGLNEILAKYEAPHGINQNKYQFHKMWAQGITSLFDQRPLDAVYREYCIKDVLDLPFIQRRMMEVGEVDVGLARWISYQYVRYGYLATLEQPVGKNKQ